MGSSRQGQNSLAASFKVAIGAAIISGGIFFIGGGLTATEWEWGLTGDLIFSTVTFTALSLLVGYGAGRVLRTYKVPLLIGVISGGLGVALFFLWENLTKLGNLHFQVFLPLLGMIFACCIGIIVPVRSSGSRRDA